MQKRFLLKSLVLGALLATTGAMAQDKFKIGLILPMTGPFASTGKQIEAAAKLYIAQNGDMVAGKKVELIVKDDTSAPDVTKRIAQELVVNDKVSVLAGFGLTPLALATAPIATQFGCLCFVRLREHPLQPSRAVQASFPAAGSAAAEDLGFETE
jgi:branched-chain amino acid transport system substrate-binding protein